mgnify:CR=1
MWLLAELHRRAEREQWRKKFGTEFTGLHDGRRVRYTWRECVVGHVCRGLMESGHSECIEMVEWRWVWLRCKA